MEVVPGALAILERLPGLHQAAESWTQSEELAELPFLLSVPVRPQRRPLLVLLHTASGNAQREELFGAVLLFAYGPRFFAGRLLSNGDRTGRRCVFSLPTERTSVAVTAARAMLQRGAALVALPYRVEADSTDRNPHAPLADEAPRQRAVAALGMLGFAPPVQWTFRSSTRRLHLPLAPHLDDTLQSVGKRTRRNIRAAMRLCERELGVRLAWNPPLSEDDLTRINAASARPVRRGVLAWSHATPTQIPGAFLAGLRTSSGEWIALAGGRQNGDTVTLDWQMNRKSFARFSVSLVMRGLLLERFGAEGVTRMRFEGGTAHTLARAFHTGTVYTFRAQRQSLFLRSFEQLLTTFFSSRAITRTLFGGGKRATNPASEPTGVHRTGSDDAASPPGDRNRQ